MAGGRPTKWSEELEQDAWAYLDDGFRDFGHPVPTVVGLCDAIKRGRSTLYDWAEDDSKGFKEILDALKEKTELYTLNRSLNNEINPQIARMLLGKFGYSEKVEQQTTATVKITGDLSDEELAAIANGN